MRSGFLAAKPLEIKPVEGQLSSLEIETLKSLDKSSAVGMYCMGSLVANQAARDGFTDFARSVESALQSFLGGMNREQQFQALQLSYELALEGVEPAPPRLRLVYSRD
jgi:hypothetical protein